MRHLTIAVDYDGTIVTDAYPHNGTLKFLAKKVLKWAEYRGHTLILWTCREGYLLDSAKWFLRKNGIRFHYYNRNDPVLIQKYKNDCRKLGCDLLVDDKAGFVCWVWVFIRILIKEIGL